MKRNFIALFVGILMDLQVILGQHGSLWNDHFEKETASMSPPTFMDTPTIVTIKEGQMAKLECSIENLGTKNVIWRRKSDPNPLTIGRRTFVDDARIMVGNRPLEPEWPLLIKQARKEDGGDYECQVASKDKNNRRYVQLIVKTAKKNKNRNRKKDKYKITDPTAGDGQRDQLSQIPDLTIPEESLGIRITGRKYVDNGQKIKLVCNATSKYHGDSLQDLDWFFNGQKLATDVNNKRTIQKRVSLMDQTIDSVLVIKSADMSDAGVYICRTSELQIVSARVDVLNAGTSNVKRRTEKEKTLDGKRSSQRSSSSSQDESGSGSRTSHLFSISALSSCFIVSMITTGNLKRVIFYQKWLPV